MGVENPDVRNRRPPFSTGEIDTSRHHSASMGSREGTSLRGARAADCAAEKTASRQGLVPKYSVGVSPTTHVLKSPGSSCTV